MNRIMWIFFGAITAIVALSIVWLLRFEYNDDKTARVNRLTSEYQFLCGNIWASSVEECVAALPPVADSRPAHGNASTISTAEMIRELALEDECDRLRKEGDQKLAEEERQGVNPWERSWNTVPPWCTGVHRPSTK